MDIPVTLILLCLISLYNVEARTTKGRHHLEEAARVADNLKVDHNELLRSSEGYRNLTRDGVPQKRVIGILSGVSAGFSILKGIAEKVDMSRACVIGLKNMGNRRLSNPTWYLRHGIIKQPLPRFMMPNTTGIFTFEKSSYSPAGTNGVFTYTIEGTDHQLVVSWSVPTFYGIYSNEFNVQIIDSVQANKTLLNLMEAHEDKLTVWDGGHWLTSSLEGVTVNGAMTNNAKASLLVELEYEMLSLGSVIG